MSLNFKQIPNGSGGFFKPADHFNDVAILIEVKRYEAERPSAEYGPRPAIHADLTYFGSMDELDAGTPTSVEAGVVIQGKALVGDLEDMVGNATIATVDQLKPKSAGRKGAYIWRTPTQAVQQKVIAYAEKREAQINEAKSSGEMPDFLTD